MFFATQGGAALSLRSATLHFAHPRLTQRMRLGAQPAPHPYFLPFSSDKIIRKRAKNIAYAGTLAEIFLCFSRLSPNCFKKFSNFFFFFIRGDMVLPPLRYENDLLNLIQKPLT